MKIIPQGDWLIVKPLNDEVTYGSLHLPDTAKAKANNGVVMAVGQWVNTIAPGDWVVFSRKQAQDYVSEAGETLIFIRERGCICTLEDTNETPRV